MAAVLPSAVRCYHLLRQLLGSTVLRDRSSAQQQQQQYPQLISRCSLPRIKGMAGRNVGHLHQSIRLLAIVRISITAATHAVPLPGSARSYAVSVSFAVFSRLPRLLVTVTVQHLRTSSTSHRNNGNAQNWPGAYVNGGSGGQKGPQVRSLVSRLLLRRTQSCFAYIRRFYQVRMCGWRCYGSVSGPGAPSQPPYAWAGSQRNLQHLR